MIPDAIVAVTLVAAVALASGWLGARIALQQTRVVVWCVHDDPECRHVQRKDERTVN